MQILTKLYVVREMQVTVYPSAISGTVSAVPSKSHAQRAIAIAALTSGKSTLRGVGTSNDILVALHLAAELGGFVEQEDTCVIIDGGHLWTSREWHCGESGLCLRMFAAIAALRPLGVTLTGEGSLNTRPVGFVEESLRAMDVTVKSTDGRPPLYVRGPYPHGRLMADASVSSQFLSGLLIALPLMTDDSRITVPSLVSRPYIDLTLEVIRDFGVTIGHQEYSDFHVMAGKYQPTNLTIEGDWSGMANILACAAINGNVHLHGLKYPSAQADCVIVDILQSAGAPLTTAQGSVSAGCCATLPAFDVDATDCPDLVPVLAALAAYADGTSLIRGVNRIRTKESNRAEALESEFRKLKVDIALQDDVLRITGGTVEGGIVDAHADHRMAMSLATAALRATGPVTITGAESVRKSYPDFFDDLRNLGTRIEMH